MPYSFTFTGEKMEALDLNTPLMENSTPWRYDPIIHTLIRKHIEITDRPDSVKESQFTCECNLNRIYVHIRGVTIRTRSL